MMPIVQRIAALLASPQRWAWLLRRPQRRPRAPIRRAAVGAFRLDTQ